MILGMNFLSMPADFTAASSKTASLLDNFFLCANPASKKKKAVKDISHKRTFPPEVNASVEPPPPLFEELPFFAAFLHFLLQVSL